MNNRYLVLLVTGAAFATILAGGCAARKRVIVTTLPSATSVATVQATTTTRPSMTEATVIKDGVVYREATVQTTAKATETTATAKPTAQPTNKPTAKPTKKPTAKPTKKPTESLSPPRSLQISRLPRRHTKRPTLLKQRLRAMQMRRMAQIRSPESITVPGHRLLLTQPTITM